MILKRLTRYFVMMMACVMVSLPVQAGMVSTAQMASEVTGIEFLNVVEQRNWIREQLVLGGVDQVDAALRVENLTDAQVAQLHQRIDQQPAGGNILLFGIVLLLVSELVGWTDIIPGIRPVD